LDLVAYLRKQLQEGYDISTLKNALLKYGYSEQEINSAVRSVYNLTEVKHTIHFSKSAFGVIIGVVATIILVVGFILYNINSTPELLDVRITSIDNEVDAGDSISFSVELFNLGSKRTYDVELRYEVVDNFGNSIGVKEETVALQTKASSSSSLSIPKDAGGSYLLKVIALYNGKTARASSSFIVNKVQECVPDCSGKECGLNGCGGSCGSCSGSSECIDFRCRQIIIEEEEEVIEEDEPEEDLDDEEISLQEIKELSKKDFSRAIGQCDDFDTVAGKDLCYLEISIEANNKLSCENIMSDIQRDQCYMNYALNNNDYSICDEITNDNLKESCELLGG